jgi:hypothetical protein
MKLSQRIEDKVELAIENLTQHGVLAIERQTLDYEFWPAPRPPMDGSQGIITTYMVALFAPCGPDDHVTHVGVLFDPYGYQSQVDTLVWNLLQEIRKEQDAFKNNMAQRLAEGPQAPSGLFIRKD